ncbi:hypothetical protein V8C86DRAFT_2943312, partial [Haematococcus lacustris]
MRALTTAAACIACTFAACTCVFQPRRRRVDRLPQPSTQHLWQFSVSDSKIADVKGAATLTHHLQACTLPIALHDRCCLHQLWLPLDHGDLRSLAAWLRYTQDPNLWMRHTCNERRRKGIPMLRPKWLSLYPLAPSAACAQQCLLSAVNSARYEVKEIHWYTAQDTTPDAALYSCSLASRTHHSGRQRHTPLYRQARRPPQPHQPGPASLPSAQPHPPPAPLGCPSVTQVTPFPPGLAQPLPSHTSHHITLVYSSAYRDWSRHAPWHPSPAYLLYKGGCLAHVVCGCV